jgi:ABC-type transporter Mla subunit MlaD
VPVQDLTPQLRTRLSRVERVVGVFVSVATLLLLAGFAYYVYHTGQRKGWWTFKARYHTFVESGAGLGVGGDVRLLGFSVGKITEVTAMPPFNPYGAVYLSFYVLDPYQGYIWTDSAVRVVAGDFLGGRIIEVTPGGSSFKTNKEAAVFPTYTPTNGTFYVYDEKTGAYHTLDPGATNGRPKGYTLFAKESPAVTERLETIANQVEGALPGILDLTNRINLVMSNIASVTAEAQSVIVGAGPIITNVAVITANLRDPKGSLGDWALPTNLHTQLLQTLSSANSTLTNATRVIGNTDTNVTTLMADLDQTLINLANITSNLNQQVQSNTNLVKSISDLIINADDMMQGLKRHWFLRGAFKKKAEEEEKQRQQQEQQQQEPSRRTAPQAPRAGKWR